MKYYIDYIEQAAIDRKYEESKNAVVPNINNGVSIEFKNVSFKYPNTDVYILKNINTIIHSGEHLSIVRCRKNNLHKITLQTVRSNGRRNTCKWSEYKRHRILQIS